MERDSAPGPRGCREISDPQECIIAFKDRHANIQDTLETQMRLVLILILALTPSLLHARCDVTDHTAYPAEVLVQRLEDCFNREIRRLERKIRTFERTLKAYEALIEAQPVPYVNRNSVIEVEDNRPIGSAKFILASRQTGGANSLALDPKVLGELCGASQCALTVRMRRLKLIGTGTGKVDTMGPCGFLYNAEKGEWSLGAGCGRPTSISGRDGDGALDPDNERQGFLASAGGACHLSESDMASFSRSEFRLLDDYAKGLFLISVPDLQSDGATRYECEIELRK